MAVDHDDTPGSGSAPFAGPVFGTTAEAAADLASARVEGWIAAIRPVIDSESPTSDGAVGALPDLLEGARRDAGGFAFTRQLLEAVVSTNDPFAAALGLRAASHELPPSLPARDRLAVRAGGVASLGLPWAVLPVARRWLRDRVSHLVLAARLPGGEGRERGDEHSDRGAARLHAALRANASSGVATLIALGGDAVLGARGAAREVERLVRLARDPEVAHLAVDPARLIPASATGTGRWSLDADAERGATLLAPLLAAAREHAVTVSFEPSDYRGALLAPELLARILEDPEHAGVRLGVHLPAELPESREAAERLILIASERVTAGGEPVELTVGAAGLTDRAQVDALLDGLAVPTLEGREAVRAQLLRLVELVLAAGPAVGLVVATEDPQLLAAVTLAAEHSGAGIALQLRAGPANALVGGLVEHGFRVRVRMPLVVPKELSGAVDGLIRLASEAAEPGSALLRAADLGGSDAQAKAVARTELARVIELAAQPFPPSHRTQLRGREWDPESRDSAFFYRTPDQTERLDTGGLTAAVLGLGRDATGQIVVEADGPARRVPVVSESGFAAEPDTDASRLANREWARRVLTRAGLLRASWAADTATGVIDLAQSEALDRDALLQGSDAIAAAWRAQRASERSTRLIRLALGTASARDRLLAVLVAETGAPVAALDAEISGAIDAARYLGRLAGGLGAVRGAEFQPDRLALVVADPGSALAERAEAVLAVLAAGSAVVLVAHADVARSSAALIEEWEAAGLPSGMVALAVAPLTRGAHAQGDADEHVEFAAGLGADRRIDRAIVLGSRATARALIRRRPDLRVEGRLRALGSVLVAPSADPDAAVRDAVRSAFGGASESRSARALVLLGSAARSKRLRRQLADAVVSLRVGDTGAVAGSDPLGSDPLSFDVGPLFEAPRAAGLRALTRLDPGESWLVEPEQLDESGRLWRPGVRLGVRRDARFWEDALGMPVIGVIAAGSLAEAIELQNRLGGGGVAGLHGVDPSETLPWIDGVRAASLSIGRATTWTRIERQPGGGWGLAGMGVQPLAGGPNRLFALGSWRLREGTPSSTLHLRGLGPEVQTLIETAQESLDYPSFDRVRRAALADALSWRTSLGRVRDGIGIGVERNLLRHWPVGTHVRLAEGGSLAELLRVLAAGLLVGAPLSVSTGQLLPVGVSDFLEAQGIGVSLERDDAWLERMAVIAAGGAGSGAVLGAERIRLIGGDRVRAAEWLGGQDRVALWAEPVTMAGPVELLVFLREQSISITANRYGLVSPPAGVDARLAELDALVAPTG